jgi:dihydrofolate synthase/folylpolyglutamate synthase
MSDASVPDARYRWATGYLRALIQAPPGPPPGIPPEIVRLRAQRRMERLRDFLAYLGNPHRVYPVIHITGTSGKGSTAAFIANILHVAGYRTGLHTSPYLQVETEKLQIAGQLIAPERFAEEVAILDQAVRSWIARGGQPLTYGEFWTALVFQTLRSERVDVAVIEVSVGGRFDLTNVVLPEVAVITTVGLDHVRTLGPTIRDIAWHKAGIIKPGRPAITGVTDPELLAIIAAEADAVGASLTVVREGSDYGVTSTGLGTTLTDLRTGHTFPIGLLGSYQARNAALAIAAIRTFADRIGGRIDDETIARGLVTTRFPGRFEIIQETPLVILDGAHNPQKMAALLEALDALSVQGRRLALFGVLEGHDALTMATMLAKSVDMVVLTTPRAFLRTAADPVELAAACQAQGTHAVTVDDPAEALALVLEMAQPNDLIVVTGSLYLVGHVREHWYPSSLIVTQRTCWPIRRSIPIQGAESACRQQHGSV